MQAEHNYNRFEVVILVFLLRDFFRVLSFRCLIVVIDGCCIWFVTCELSVTVFFLSFFFFFFFFFFLLFLLVPLVVFVLRLWLFIDS